MNSEAEALGPRGIVALVTARGGGHEALGALASQARLTVQRVASAQEVGRLAQPPVAVLLPLASSPGEWALVRGEAKLATVPLLGVAPEATELAFAETFARGGDDLLALDRPGDTLTRLRALVGWHEGTRRPPRAEPAERRALIVGRDASWRADTARQLQRAGIEADFAVPGEPLGALTASHTVGVIEATGQLDAAWATLGQLQTGGATMPWVVAVTPDELGAARELFREGRVAVHDRLGLADALPFVINELLATDRSERRQSPRLLFATRVWARSAGSEQDQIGYSYTVSEGGLFWRSLAPFAVGTSLWLELQAPRVGQRVRLAATVAWSRGFGPLGQALSPPGSGLRIEGGLPGDWERFQAGCHALLAGRRRP